eukprot:9857123-Heterocapsa_arctica.AAC.1
MEYGRPEERITYKRTAMEIVFFVVKRMQASITYGGNAERSTSTRISATSNSCKLGKEHNQPECFWNTGVVTTYWTTLPDSEHMTAEDLCHE